MYWIKLIKDIRLWAKFAKITKESRKYLEDHNLRVDWIGRMYTVINLPEEVQQGNEYTHEAWILQNLGPYNKIIEKIGLSSYAVPEMRKIKEPGTAAYLLILLPLTETISFWRFIKNLFIWIGGFLILRGVYNYFEPNLDFSYVWESIKSFLF